MIKLEIYFYADGFKDGIIEVPDEFKDLTKSERRKRISEFIASKIPHKKWKIQNSYDVSEDTKKMYKKLGIAAIDEFVFPVSKSEMNDTIQINTCKILNN